MAVEVKHDRPREVASVIAEVGVVTVFKILGSNRSWMNRRNPLMEGAVKYMSEGCQLRVEQDVKETRIATNIINQMRFKS
jgi:hypothetical protein